jgi:hypothetical protein
MSVSTKQAILCGRVRNLTEILDKHKSGSEEDDKKFLSAYIERSRAVRALLDHVREHGEVWDGTEDYL